ncbi:hypothetical protein PENSPDRAFT_686829 [Peniophora sp. CONT]|nr:hypothetical protein PENSPDRAFT_686829 [Peniophora sp. CONT]
MASSRTEPLLGPDIILPNKKIYSVKVGRKTGFYTTWFSAHKQIDRYGGACHKSFLNGREALCDWYLHLVISDLPITPPTIDEQPPVLRHPPAAVPPPAPEPAPVAPPSVAEVPVVQAPVAPTPVTPVSTTLPAFSSAPSPAPTSSESLYYMDMVVDAVPATPPSTPEPAIPTSAATNTQGATLPVPTAQRRSRHPVVTPDIVVAVSDTIARLEKQHLAQARVVPPASSSSRVAARPTSSQVMEELNTRIAQLSIPGKTLKSVAAEKSRSTMTFTMLNGENLYEIVSDSEDGDDERSVDSDRDVSTGYGSIRANSTGKHAKDAGDVQQALDDARAVKAAAVQAEAKRFPAGASSDVQGAKESNDGEVRNAFERPQAATIALWMCEDASVGRDFWEDAVHTWRSRRDEVENEYDERLCNETDELLLGNYQAACERLRVAHRIYEELAGAEEHLELVSKKTGKKTCEVSSYPPRGTVAHDIVHSECSQDKGCVKEETLKRLVDGLPGPKDEFVRLFGLSPAERKILLPYKPAPARDADERIFLQPTSEGSPPRLLPLPLHVLGYMYFVLKVDGDYAIYEWDERTNMESLKKRYPNAEIRPFYTHGEASVFVNNRK